MLFTECLDHVVADAHRAAAGGLGRSRATCPVAICESRDVRWLVLVREPYDKSRATDEVLPDLAKPPHIRHGRCAHVPGGFLNGIGYIGSVRSYVVETCRDPSVQPSGLGVQRYLELVTFDDERVGCRYVPLILGILAHDRIDAVDGNLHGTRAHVVVLVLSLLDGDPVSRRSARSSRRWCCRPLRLLLGARHG